MIPDRFIHGRRNARVEMNPGNRPAPGGTDIFRQFFWIEIRVRVAKGCLGVMEEVLAVEECDSALDGGLNRHDYPK
jgi:hypothetical protein